jgi:hypothetical protein
LSLLFDRLGLDLLLEIQNVHLESTFPDRRVTRSLLLLSIALGLGQQLVGAE